MINLNLMEGGLGNWCTGISDALSDYLPIFDTACIATYVNGRAGERFVAVRGGAMPAPLRTGSWQGYSKMK